MKSTRPHFFRFFGALLYLTLAMPSPGQQPRLLEAKVKPDSPEKAYSVRWIGNSFPGARKWVQQDIQAMLVTDDGTIFTNAEWDEAGREVGVYRNGDVLGKAGHTHGWGYHGGRAIAVNDEYVFIAQKVDSERGGLKDPGTWPAKGNVWYGVARRLRSDITRPAPFPGGKGGKGDTLKGGFLVVNEVPEKTRADIRGFGQTRPGCMSAIPMRRRSACTMRGPWACSSVGRWSGPVPWPWMRRGPCGCSRRSKAIIRLASRGWTPTGSSCPSR